MAFFIWNNRTHVAPNEKDVLKTETLKLNDKIAWQQKSDGTIAWVFGRVVRVNNDLIAEVKIRAKSFKVEIVKAHGTIAFQGTAKLGDRAFCNMEDYGVDLSMWGVVIDVDDETLANPRMVKMAINKVSGFVTLSPNFVENLLRTGRLAKWDTRSRKLFLK